LWRGVVPKREGRALVRKAKMQALGRKGPEGSVVNTL